MSIIPENTPPTDRPESHAREPYVPPQLEQLDEVPVRALVDLLDAGAPLDAAAAAAGTTPIGLVCAAVEWLAQHRDALTPAEHARACQVLADALGGDR